MITIHKVLCEIESFCQIKHEDMGTTIFPRLDKYGNVIVELLIPNSEFRVVDRAYTGNEKGRIGTVLPDAPQKHIHSMWRGPDIVAVDNIIRPDMQKNDIGSDAESPCCVLECCV